FIGGALSLVVAWIGSTLIEQNAIEFSDITVYTQYCGLILVGIFMMIVVFVTMPKAMTSAKRIYEVIDTPISIVDAEQPETPKEIGTIEFKDVSFVYPGAEAPAIRHLSFKVERGQTLAFIGATGSGKSTVLNLLLRFFDVSEGEVLVDGVNVKDYKLDDLFARFGYVPQRGYLFHDTLRNNVCLGKTDASEEQVERALSISESRDFVAKLPGTLDYEISQGGKNVSGGQRQRLCIARAILMEPEIFVFDDSFSALDYRTDKILRTRIKEECVDVTNVIVAQRVGTIIDADQIIVLDEGNVVGHGTHEELLKNCPVYQEIASSQLGKEEK
ncbi:MAG: ABC transporter ATP-binding protein, partial [Bacilli bacterium]|nr:ABC transporter ATP-binding protein [Bacilli bacterium]